MDLCAGDKAESRYQVYSEYKDSGVAWLGRVPRHWKIKRLGQYLPERREKVSDKDFAPLSVTKLGVVPQLETAAKTDAGDNRKLVREGDFVINSRSDRKGSSGLSELEGSVSLISIVLTPREIEPRFVHRLLKSYPFQEEFYRYGKGIVADLWSTNYSEMKNILLPIPEPSEQKVIAAFLDYETARIDGLIEKQQRLIELLKEKRQAVISHAVTKGLNPDAPMKDSGVEWLGQVPEHWEVQALKFCAELNPSKSKCKGDKAEYCSFVPMERLKLDSLNVEETRVIADVFDGYTYFADGDVLLAKVTPCFENKNMALAKGLRNGIGFGSSEIYVLRPQNCDARYLFYRLQEENFMSVCQSAMTGAGGLKRVPSETLRNYQFAMPSLLEQQEISRSLDLLSEQLRLLIDRANDAVQLLQERRIALISAAVTGKIDLRGWKAPDAT